MEEKINYLKKVNEFIDSDLGTMREIASEDNNLFYKIIEFPLKIITVLGVFAGFGFTGVSHVKNIWLFAAGELFFAVAVILGLNWYKKIVVSHKVTYKKYIEGLGEHIDRWQEIGLTIAREGCDDEKFKKYLSEMQNKGSEIFKKKPEGNDFIINVVLWFFPIAVILLLLSFLPINYIWEPVLKIPSYGVIFSVTALVLQLLGTGILAWPLLQFKRDLDDDLIVGEERKGEKYFYTRKGFLKDKRLGLWGLGLLGLGFLIQLSSMIL